MREIKFRAWDGERMMPVQAMYWNEDGTMAMPHFTMNGGVFMQYTGLKDKNGKEIYEGDIVKNIIGTTELIKYKAHFGCCCPNMVGYMLSGGNMDEADREVEIIGNIYESPELIKTT